MKLHNRTAIITGASRGFGKFLAWEFLKQGANIALCSRNAEDMQAEYEALSNTAINGQKVAIHTCDVSNPALVDEVVNTVIKDFGKLDILVNNAGIYGPMGTIETVNWEEWVQAIEINLYGVVLMCRAVVPHMRERKYGKIINLSGGGATSPMPRISAYAAAKAAVVRFTESLALEVRDANIDVNAIAPGALNTAMLDEAIAAGPERVGYDFYQRMQKIKAQGATPMEKGAKLCIYLASSKSDGVSGKLISAVWDAWDTMDEHRDDLDSDIYTLRRIIPKDRGMGWGEVE